MIEILTDYQRSQFETLIEILIEQNETTNLTRIVNPDEIRVKHFEDSLIVLDMLTDFQQAKNLDSLKLIDIGSGAGFPGLAIAIARPGWQITSVDSTGKKVDFQNCAAKELKLENFTAIKGRAEDLGQDWDYREDFNVVTARALGHLKLISELAIPLISVGGLFLAWKGPKVETEIPQATTIISRLGGGKIEQIPYCLADNQDFRIVKIQKEVSTPSKYPRHFKDIKKSQTP